MNSWKSSNRYRESRGQISVFANININQGPTRDYLIDKIKQVYLRIGNEEIKLRHKVKKAAGQWRADKMLTVELKGCIKAGIERENRRLDINVYIWQLMHRHGNDVSKYRHVYMQTFCIYDGYV